MRKKKGWRNEPVRHGLSAKGVETSFVKDVDAELEMRADEERMDEKYKSGYRDALETVRSHIELIEQDERRPTEVVEELNRMISNKKKAFSDYEHRGDLAKAQYLKGQSEGLKEGKDILEDEIQIQLR